MELSIYTIITQAIQSIKNNLGFFVAITLLIFAMSAAVDFTYAYIESESRLIGFGYGLVGLALYVKQAVVIHRSVILDETNRWDKVFSWGSPDNQFLLICVGLWVLFALSIGILSGLAIAFLSEGSAADNMETSLYYLVLPLLLISGFIFSRICLIFPSRAVGEKMSLEESFTLTKSKGFKMFMLIVLLPLAINMLLGELMIEDSLIYNLMISLIAHLIVVFQVSVLSHAFIALTKNHNKDQPDQVAI